MPHLAQFDHDGIRMQIKRIRDNNDPVFLCHRVLLIRAIFLPREETCPLSCAPNATGLLTKGERESGFTPSRDQAWEMRRDTRREISQASPTRMGLPRC